MNSFLSHSSTSLKCVIKYSVNFIRSQSNRNYDLNALIKYRSDTAALFGQTVRIQKRREEWIFNKTKLKKVNRPNRMEANYVKIESTLDGNTIEPHVNEEYGKPSSMDPLRVKQSAGDQSQAIIKSEESDQCTVHTGMKNTLDRKPDGSKFVENRRGNGNLRFRSADDKENVAHDKHDINQSCTQINDPTVWDDEKKILRYYSSQCFHTVSALDPDSFLNYPFGGNSHLIDINSELPLPSVTQVLMATQSTETRRALAEWKKRKIIALGGEEEFNLYQHSIIDRGVHFHKFLMHHFSNCTIGTNDEIKLCWESIQSILPKLSNVKFQEHSVRHQQLGYRGVIDCMADISNKTCVVEWKTTEKPKYTILDTYDYPIQVAAYLGAIKSSGMAISTGAIVYAVNDGSPGSLFLLSNEQCELYWSLWCRRLCDFWTKVKTFNNKIS